VHLLRRETIKTTTYCFYKTILAAANSQKENIWFLMQLSRLLFQLRSSHHKWIANDESTSLQVQYSISFWLIWASTDVTGKKVWSYLLPCNLQNLVWLLYLVTLSVSASLINLLTIALPKNKRKNKRKNNAQYNSQLRKSGTLGDQNEQ